MTGKAFLRPTTDPTTGKPFLVFVPRKGRTISPDGESLVVDAFLERRISSGELKRAEAPTPAPVETKHSRRPTAPRGDTADEPTPITGD